MYSFLPVSSGVWWYLSAYVILSIFIPIINSMLHAINKRQTCYLIAGILVFSIIPCFLGDFVVVNGGYSAVWLASMYIIGACAKKYNVADFIKTKYCVLIYLASVFIICISRILIGIITIRIFNKVIGTNLLLNYLSPFVVFMAFSLLLFFVKIKLKSNRIISTVASLSFAVYLIHDHLMNRVTFISKKFIYLSCGGVLELIATVMGVAISIYAVGILVEYIRVKLFKITKLTDIISNIGNYIDNYIKL